MADSDPAAAKALLEEMERDVQQALDETAQLAQRIYPPLLEAGGLAAALRSAAVAARIPASVEVATGATYPHEIAATVYLCSLEVLDSAGEAARATVTVRTEKGTVDFEVTADGGRSESTAADPGAGLGAVRDRVEALGGRLAVDSQPGRGTRVSGSLPLPR